MKSDKFCKRRLPDGGSRAFAALGSAATACRESCDDVNRTHIGRRFWSAIDNSKCSVGREQTRRDRETSTEPRARARERASQGRGADCQPLASDTFLCKRSLSDCARSARGFRFSREWTRMNANQTRTGKSKSLHLCHSRLFAFIRGHNLLPHSEHPPDRFERTFCTTVPNPKRSKTPTLDIATTYEVNT